MASHSPPLSTPLEPCRVAPYVNLSSMRPTNLPTTSASHQFSNGAAAVAAAAAFSAFDPALLTAAHQVYIMKTQFLLLNSFVYFIFSMQQQLAVQVLVYFQFVSIHLIWLHWLQLIIRIPVLLTYD